MDGHGRMGKNGWAMMDEQGWMGKDDGSMGKDGRIMKDKHGWIGKDGWA